MPPSAAACLIICRLPVPRRPWCRLQPVRLQRRQAVLRLLVPQFLLPARQLLQRPLQVRRSPQKPEAQLRNRARFQSNRNLFDLAQIS